MGIRILIVDDHGVIRAGLRALLAEAGLEVVGETGDGAEALRLASELSPDVILMDISMPGMGGLEATRRLKEILPGVQVLILTMHEDEGFLREAIRAGAAGYIPKRAAESELIQAIEVVSRGDMYIHTSLTRVLVGNLSPLSSTQKRAIETITPREIDVLRLLIRGYTNRQIAEKLHLSKRTVESYRSNLMGKLDLHSRVELMDFADEQGLLSLEDD